MSRLGVVGLVSLDRVDGSLPRLGGAPTYAARALRLLGHPAALATKIAPEDRPRLAALGLPVAWRPTAKTIAFRIENRGDRRSLTLEEAGEPWTAADAQGWVGDALRGADIIHAGALTRADFGSETLARLRRGRRLSLDAQGLVRGDAPGEVVLSDDFDPDTLRHVDVLKASEEEAGELSLAELGVPEVVVTLGRHGVLVHVNGRTQRVPTRPLRGVDTTGAGDAWITTYLSYRIRRHGPRSAAQLANELVHALLSA